MRSNFAKSLFATLAIASAATAMEPQARDARTMSAQALSASPAAGGFQAVGTTQARGQMSAEKEARLVIATAPIASDFRFEGAARHRDLSGRDAPLEVKDWTLVLIGVFLIGAISRRRYQSITD